MTFFPSLKAKHSSSRALNVKTSTLDQRKIERMSRAVSEMFILQSTRSPIRAAARVIYRCPCENTYCERWMPTCLSDCPIFYL